MMTENEVLARIAAIRKSKGLSQDFVSMQMDISQAGYMLIETGQRRLDLPRILKLSEILEVDVRSFFQETIIEKTDVKCTLQVELKSEQQAEFLKRILGDENYRIFIK